MKDQVGQVITETSKKDWLIRFSWLVTKSGSPCGRFGFKQKSTFSKEIDVTDFSHSDFNDKNRFEKQFLLHLFDEPVQLKVVHGGDLDMRTILKYFKDTELIDKEAYGNDYNNSKPVTLDMAKQWALMEKNIWSFMIETFNETVVGYFNVMAVDDATMDKFVLGQISEADILANNIKRFEQGTHLNIIIMAVSLDTQTQERWGGVIGSKPGELITAALSDKLVNITNNGSKLKRIACIAWTPAGQGLCDAFGLIQTSNTILGHPIYGITAEELSKLTSSDVNSVCYWYLRRIQQNLKPVTSQT